MILYRLSYILFISNITFTQMYIHYSILLLLIQSIQPTNINQSYSLCVLINNPDYSNLNKVQQQYFNPGIKLNKTMSLTNSRFKLKSSQSFNSINKSQTNRSVSKQAHLFSKSPRFSLPKPTCQQHYYAGQEIKSKRPGIGIGYSFKSDFTKDLACSRGSSRYHIKSEIDEKVNKKKGFFMGLGRDNIIQGQYINRDLCRTPSSNKYNINLSNRKKEPSYSIRHRTKMINKTMTIQSQNQNPGPTQYNNPQLKMQSYASKFATISYALNKSKRFEKEKIKSPGPGAYNQASMMSNIGKYIVSKNEGGTIAKFGNSKRITKFDQVIKSSKLIPGAGKYQAPSQFGRYDHGCL